MIWCSKKSQLKKVVCEVPVADGGVSTDLWAWRKYGQKPIKGSPYPRSAELLLRFFLQQRDWQRGGRRPAAASEQTHLTGCSVS